MQIAVSIQRDDCEEFVRHLRELGHEADVVIANESFIDGTDIMSSVDLYGQFNELWECYYGEKRL